MSDPIPRFGDLSIGKAAADEFIRLPRLPALFEKRAERIRKLAEGSPTTAFMLFMGRVFQAQAAACAAVAAVEAPSAETMARASEHVMPPLAPDGWTPTPTYRETLRFIASHIPRDGLPELTVAALNGIAEAADGHLDSLARAFVASGMPPQWQGEALFAVAALQVEFARVAALIDKRVLQPLDAAGLCPVCGSHPVAGVVVADEAYGRRYLTCGLCSTSWHYVRVACVSCGGEKHVAYHEIEGGNGATKCETCDDCHSYSKLFYQVKDMGIEALCDDLATLSLDLLVNDAGWKRHAPNPFVPTL
jgi:FdhE protein